MFILEVSLFSSCAYVNTRYIHYNYISVRDFFQVKKMDKPMESKRPVTSAEPVERFLKRYETLISKDFSSRRPDAREQIIEEQIEEYKKKREKVLGGQSAITFTVNETQKEVQEEEISVKSNFEKAEEEIIKEISKEEDEEKKEGEEEEKMEKGERIDEGQEKTIDNTEEYLSKLSRLKLKWEETKRKKESLQKELDESYSEGNLEKLAKVLGEKEKNLQVIEISSLDTIKTLILFFLIYLVFLSSIVKEAIRIVGPIFFAHIYF